MKPRGHVRTICEENDATLAPDASPHSMRGRLGAYARWANTEDRFVATQAARDGFYAKFEREVRSRRQTVPPGARETRRIRRARPT
ncbi:MAG: hypothetical protein JWP86_3296 [Phenylobacterium sp.]|jgi:hypothetical protein|nr:hypothetical protein [Phenylobacterium sp.]